MKNLFKLLTVLIFIYPMTGLTEGIDDFKSKFSGDVKKQSDSDKERKEALLRKMRGFMDGINNRVNRGGGKTNIDLPIDMANVTDIDDKIHKNSTGFDDYKKPKVYGYINGDDVNIRAAGSTNEKVVGKGEFGEKVEVTVQTDYQDEIDGKKSRWVMIRRTNDEEGWVFGIYLSKEKPEKKIQPDDTGKDSIASSKSGFQVPATGRVSSNFGYRVDPITKKPSCFHSGVDIAAPAGTPIYAAAAGKVSYSEFNQNGYGNLIIILHEKELSTYYAHQAQRVVSVGQQVMKGQLIGKVGSTGRSTGPHLHFEVRKGQTAVDPSQFIPR